MAHGTAGGIASIAGGVRTPLNRQQIIGFWAAWFGWMLDGMDSVIYALVLGPALTELLPLSGMEATPANIGYVVPSCSAFSWWVGAFRSSGGRSQTGSVAQSRSPPRYSSMRHSRELPHSRPTGTSKNSDLCEFVRV
jgi:hypothetical protein